MPIEARFAGGRIDGLVRVAGAVLSTRDAAEKRPADGVLKRVLETPLLRLEHWLCAPLARRPIRLARVWLISRAREALAVEYTEIWEIHHPDYRTEPGAAVVRTPDGERALADAGIAILARPPRDPPQGGLALDVRVLLPGGEARCLQFAYAAPGPDEPAAVLVRAWRGGVERELDRRLVAGRASQGH
ncbi:MAG: hypothetical protein ACE5IL_02260 [Myxococcota bacterium]